MIFWLLKQIKLFLQFWAIFFSTFRIQSAKNVTLAITKDTARKPSLLHALHKKLLSFIIHILRPFVFILYFLFPTSGKTSYLPHKAHMRLMWDWSQ